MALGFSPCSRGIAIKPEVANVPTVLQPVANTMPFLRLCCLGLTLLATFPLAAQAPLNVVFAHLHNPLPSAAPIYRPHAGTYDSAYVWLGIGTEGVVMQPPVTVRTHLPEGVEFVRHTGSNWTCDAADQAVTCVSTAAIPAPSYNSSFQPWPHALGQFSLYTDVSPTTPGNTTVSVRSSVSSAQFPADLDGSCTTPNQCRSIQTQILPSSLNVTMSYSGQTVWNPGTQRAFSVQSQVAGYNINNGPIRIRSHLPPGLSYSHASGVPANGWICDPQPSGPEGQRIDCVLSALPIDTTVTSGMVSVAIYSNVDVDVPVPGWLPVVSDVDMALQPAPVDCSVEPLPRGCARLLIPTGLQPSPRLIVDKRVPERPTGMDHAPGTFVVGEGHGFLRLHYRNAGDDAAQTSRLYVQLPTGAAFHDTLNSYPNATCEVTGTTATGQVLNCTAAGLPTGGGHDQAVLSMRIRAELGIEAPSTVVLAAVSGDPATEPAAALNGCSANPAQAHCALHELPTFVPCAAVYGADGVFCNDFEPISTTED